MRTMIKLIGLLVTPIIFAIPAQANLMYSQGDINQFKSTNKCPGCDLSSIDNFSLSVGDNHSSADLSKADLTKTSFVHSICLTHANLEDMNFSNGNAASSNFSYADARNAVFVDSYLEDAVFSYADLTGSTFINADVNNANFYGAKGLNLKGVKNECNAILPDGSKGVCN
ncbi:pentapeptide repeat-containing protein [Piscirickettsia litoralis]|uniref:Pentapeptide repeat-containing protein n=1 Tax=Piscirickettsia litoralis TaxID=1891921 RepID=A0ABX3A2C7_9GAMM|nr:pentapeptide repeat-containing protein [Piscirickettsia litoralis]ODN41540.1 hypothetical protein BGC07_15645 [Piscirickettsia litoralis]